MVSIAWIVCPNCKKKFYVEKPQLGKGANWMCPFCKNIFKDNKAIENR